MKLLFMGGGEDAPELLRWTTESVGIEIVGIVGDDNLHRYARMNGLPAISLETAYDNLEKNQNWCDIGISYLYWNILKNPIIDVPRYGCINFHPAPLPEYKGRAGCSFAILDKLSEWGCTAHYMDTGIDTGRIIEVTRFPFNWKQETGYSLKEKTYFYQKALYKKIICEVIAKGKLPAYEQDPTKGKYISKKDMLDAMKINPETDDVDAKIQAFWFPPHAGAYIEVRNQQYTLVNDVVLRQIVNNRQSAE